MLFPVFIGVLAGAVILGGGTRQGFLGDVAVQAASVLLLAVAMWQLPVSRDGTTEAGQPVLRDHLVFLCMMLGVLLLLANPFHVDLSAFGVPITEGSGGLFHETPGQAVASHNSRAAAISFLVPVSVFIAGTMLGREQRIKVMWLLLALGGLSALLGLVQVAQGPSSPLRFFAFTNPTEAVGFFANRNHFAAFLYAMVVLAVVPLSILVRRVAGSGRTSSRDIAQLCGSVALVFLLLAGVVLARSRAGLVLTMIGLVAVVIMIARGAVVGAASAKRGHARSSSGLAMRRSSVVTVLVVAGLALVALELGLHRIQSRLDQDLLHDLRYTLTAVTMQAAGNALPFGTGLGSFVTVYGILEPRAAVFSGFANRAHNDLAEIILEAGIVAAVLLALFFAWFIVRAAGIWFRPAGPGPGGDVELAHVMLQRAASIIILLFLLHSLVDYPFRTTALAAVFAFSCAMLVAPPLGVAPSSGRHGHVTGHDRPSGIAAGASRSASVTDVVLPAAQVAHVSTALPERHPREQLDLAWPSEWRSSTHSSEMPETKRGAEDAG